MNHCLQQNHLLRVTGIVNLAPLSKPTTVKVATMLELLPNKVFIVVALRLIWVPIMVLETLVPIVVVAFILEEVAASVLIPTPV